MSKQLSNIMRLFFIFAMILSFAVPVISAQDEEVTPDTAYVVVVGQVTFDGENMLVGGYVVIPPAGMDTEGIEDGDKVVVVGTLSEDGTTIEALVIELWSPDEDECDPEVDEDCVVDECDPEADDDCVVDECDPEVDEDCVIDECDPEVDEDCVIDECDPEVDEDCDLDEDEDDEEEDSRGYACARDDHPAGMKLSTAFEVKYEDIMTLFCDGYGFGEISIAYKLAGDDAELLAEILALRESGMGWGLIRKQFTAADEDVVLTKKGPKWDRQEEIRANNKEKAAKEKGNNGNGRGNGNNGNNGNGNGRGNGNNGNNGKGNGKGKGN